MTGTFEFRLSDGRTCKLEAKYECVMKQEILDADGWKIKGDVKPCEDCDNQLAAYVGGKMVDVSYNSKAWNLVVTKSGAKKISSLRVGFARQEDADRYESWIAGIIDGGKSNEVKAYEKAEEEKRIEEEVALAKAVIEKAEKQKDIPSKEEAKRRMKQYNDFMSEGGYGYVPHIYSREEYEYAKRVVAKYEN